MAITVDGVRGVGEWNGNWSYGQTEGSTYNPDGPFGDKMVIFQNGMWYDEDRVSDSGTGFNENMATVGPDESGYDIEGIYARYDFMTDTLYGLCTVYGLPGDLDGDGDPYNSLEFSDTRGAITPNNVDGIGADEFFNIRIMQGSKATRISIQNNDWTVADVGDGTTTLTAADVDAANGLVYEIKILNLGNSFDLSPGATLLIRVTAGAQDDRDPITGGLIGEDIADVFVTIPNPDVDIEKWTNGFDADTPTGPSLAPGQAVTWTYRVTNVGNVPLSNVVVTDNKLGGVPAANIISKSINNDDVLDVGELWVYQMTGIADCGQYANIGEVDADWLGIPVTDSDPSHYIVRCEPDIDIEKHTNGFDADFPSGPKIDVGETVTWEYFVTNTGNVPLKDIVVVDDKLGVIPAANIISKSMNADDILDVGETWTYEVTATVEECVPLYKNIATVTGEDDAGNTVNDEDPSHYHCQPVVPLLTPLGMVMMIGILAALGIVTLRRRD
ncbi:hypothetical protein [Methanolobus sp. WCC5]|uniref:DUF7507 domain-containing protein n=1 Tax=Methanolobus sp. WCC5 TaxID=3125785 RepID=UPI00324ED412